ncbi:hypothetical protein Patl1_07764 [Pistacia atlantica]|uniref:Uncharacterized protein n=1 Tax=Pistacia atlantica TaxID=434234 RepID=A0ACC1AKK3_9ROSI|nr:hypothetical protein Patl1_07764 [Pistacia atlantica]
MGRSPCCEKAHTNKGAWTKEEDQRLIEYIRVHGEGCWRSLPKAAGKQNPLKKTTAPAAARQPTKNNNKQQQQKRKENYGQEECNQKLNLELSIGVGPTQSELTRASSNSAESKQGVEVHCNYHFLEVKQGVCLCWQLGFHRSEELCRNCTQNSAGLFRYCSPLDS